MPSRVVPLILIVGITAIVAMWWFADRTRQTEPVKFVRAESGPMHVSVAAIAQIASRRQMLIHAPVDGQVKTVHVSDGEMVKRGQLMLQFDSAAADARTAKAESQYMYSVQAEQQAAMRYQRAKALFDIGAEPWVTVQDASERQHTAAMSVKIAREDFRLAQLQQRQAEIRAPFSGRVTVYDIQPGQWIREGVKAFAVMDMDQLELEAQIESSDATAVAVGQEVLVSSTALADGSWTERVLRVGATAEVDAKSNASFVRLGISLSRKVPLRIGQQIDIKIRTHSVGDAIKLPLSALIMRDGRIHVATEREGRVRMIPVKTGLEDLTHAQIIDGVAPGMRVILQEGRALAAGDAVTLHEEAL